MKKLCPENWSKSIDSLKCALERGDYHIYMENNAPKLGITIFHDIIQGIHGEETNNIPLEYLDIATSYVKKINYEMNKRTKKEFSIAEKSRQEITQIKQQLGKEIENKEYDKVLSYLGFKVKKDKNGMLTLSSYKQPSKNYTFADIGIDENDMFQQVKAIKGNAVFSRSELTSLYNLQFINGSADFIGSKIVSLGELESINGNAFFGGTELTSLGKLKYIDGNANFFGSQLTSLGELKSIKGNAMFWGTILTSLDKLESINGNASFFLNRQLVSLGELKFIGGDAEFLDSQLTSLGKLKTVNGNFKLADSHITSLGELEFIGGNVDFSNSQVTSLGKLKFIGCKPNFENSKFIPILQSECEHVDMQIFTKGHPSVKIIEQQQSTVGKDNGYYVSSVTAENLTPNVIVVEK